MTSTCLSLCWCTTLCALPVLFCSRTPAGRSLWVYVADCVARTRSGKKSVLGLRGGDLWRNMVGKISKNFEPQQNQQHIGRCERNKIQKKSQPEGSRKKKKGSAPFGRAPESEKIVALGGHKPHPHSKWVNCQTPSDPPAGVPTPPPSPNTLHAQQTVMKQEAK